MTAGAEFALGDGQRSLAREALDHEVKALAARLRALETRVLATLLDNGIPWVVADLAAE
jgi:hypothetical protein